MMLCYDVFLPFSLPLFLSEAAQHESKETKKGKGGSTTEGKKSASKGKGNRKAMVNPEKIELLLDMIKGADVTSEDNLAENETILELEGERGGHMSSLLVPFEIYYSTCCLLLLLLFAVILR